MISGYLYSNNKLYIAIRNLNKKNLLIIPSKMETRDTIIYIK